VFGGRGARRDLRTGFSIFIYFRFGFLRGKGRLCQRTCLRRAIGGGRGTRGGPLATRTCERHAGARYQLGELQPALNEGKRPEILAVVVKEIEREHSELVMLCAITTILVVEDEALIVLDISTAFESTVLAIAIRERIVDQRGRQTVVLDQQSGVLQGVGSRHMGATCLKDRPIPFLMYSGMPKPVGGPCEGAPYLPNPASQKELLDPMEAMIRDYKISN
jgi:hypothetical protein